MIDVCLMNPPYDAGHHLYMRFLDKVINISDKVISINPINFIFSKTNKGIHKILKETINNVSLKIEELDGNKVFKDASFLSGNVIGICEFGKKESNKNVKINFIDGSIKEYNSTNEEITRADLTNENLQSIINKLKSFSDKNMFDIFNFLPQYTGFSLKNKIKTFDDDDLFVYLPIKTDDTINYAFFSNKNSKRNNVMTVRDKQTSGGIKVNSIKEGENIIKYLKTDIIRFCYYLCINGLKLNFKGFNLMPLIDFNNNIFNNSLHDINDKVYKLFNITEEERRYIEEILPDYYNIR